MYKKLLAVVFHYHLFRRSSRQFYIPLNHFSSRNLFHSECGIIKPFYNTTMNVHLLKTFCSEPDFCLTAELDLHQLQQFISTMREDIPPLAHLVLLAQVIWSCVCNNGHQAIAFFCVSKSDQCALAFFIVCETVSNELQFSFVFQIMADKLQHRMSNILNVENDQ